MLRSRVMLSLLLLGPLLLLPSAKGLKCVFCEPGGDPPCADYKPGVTTGEKWEEECGKHGSAKTKKWVCVNGLKTGRRCMGDSGLPQNLFKCSDNFCNNEAGTGDEKKNGAGGGGSSLGKKKTQVGLLFLGTALAFLFRQMDIFGMDGNLNGVQ